ncbi:hypothetical protein UK23_32265 [Lentzea aerocolonigenes]|uniref:Uncharacterized protein n=1 Tax=Lentzea aerocolonigenes TaxID=68170 RepID=A0A0F0GNY2_LENAE|nr:hypothetical protein UK23_32265 [Lentzea aerocolonigenes]
MCGKHAPEFDDATEDEELNPVMSHRLFTHRPCGLHVDLSLVGVQVSPFSPDFPILHRMTATPLRRLALIQFGLAAVQTLLTLVQSRLPAIQGTIALIPGCPRRDRRGRRGHLAVDLVLLTDPVGVVARSAHPSLDHSGSLGVRPAEIA